MMNNRDSITHKELLTFSNLTNLEWEFADLEPSEEVDEDGNIYYEYTPLNDLLDPEAFYREDEDADDEEEAEGRYLYGGDGQGNLKSEEDGRIEMRQKAGIAMEYLEKSKAGNEEGDFLKEWEVIYAGDNYKVVADYLDYKWKRICQGVNAISDANLDEDKRRYPSREDIKSSKRWQAGIELAVSGINLGLSYWTANQGVDNVIEEASNISLGGIVKDFGSSLAEDVAEEIAEENKALSLIMSIMLNFNDPLELFSDSLDEAEKEELKSIEEEIEATAPDENPEIVTFEEDLDMRDTGFRVLSLKL